MNIENHKIEDLFRPNDGSLPCISINDLTHEQVIQIYEWIKNHSQLTPLNITYWSNSKNKDLPISGEENPAKLVITGEADNFSHTIIDFKPFNTVIKDLGVFVDSNNLEFFYRKGNHWNNDQIFSFLYAIKYILSVAPSARVLACEENGEPLNQIYQELLHSLIVKNSNSI